MTEAVDGLTGGGGRRGHVVGRHGATVGLVDGRDGVGDEGQGGQTEGGLGSRTLSRCTGPVRESSRERFVPASSAAGWASVWPSWWTSWWGLGDLDGNVRAEYVADHPERPQQVRSHHRQRTRHQRWSLSSYPSSPIDSSSLPISSSSSSFIVSVVVGIAIVVVVSPASISASSLA